MPKGLEFLATGAALPERVLTNAELSTMVDTTDEWIRSRTGIEERRIVAENEATSDLAARAARQALERAGVRPDEIDLVVVATCTPDHLFPSTACLVQKALGIPAAIAFDVSAACSGFVYALACVNGLILSGAAKTALVIGADSLSRFTDWKDRATCVLFGDGAGALLLRASEGTGGLLASHLSADGAPGEILSIPGGGSRYPVQKANGSVSAHPAFIRMEGREVFKHAVTRMVEAALAALAKAGKKPEDLALLIPHQANLRIIDAVAKRVNLPDARIFRNVQKYGNMSAATTIIALDEAVNSGRVKRGDLVELIAFGAGLTWGAAVLQW